MGESVCVRSPLPFLAPGCDCGKRGGGFSGILGATEYEKSPQRVNARGRDMKGLPPAMRPHFSISCLRSCPRTSRAPMRPRLPRASGGVA
jgi:hypothetical protein